MMTQAQIDGYALAAVVSIRRLLALRHDPRDGAMAKAHCRKWCADLRRLRAQGATA